MKILQILLLNLLFIDMIPIIFLNKLSLRGGVSTRKNRRRGVGIIVQEEGYLMVLSVASQFCGSVQQICSGYPVGCHRENLGRRLLFFW